MRAHSFKQGDLLYGLGRALLMAGMMISKALPVW